MERTVFQRTFRKIIILTTAVAVIAVSAGVYGNSDTGQDNCAVATSDTVCPEKQFPVNLWSVPGILLKGLDKMAFRTEA